MFDWPNLNQRTRDLMLDEIAQDIAQNKLYISPRLTSRGAQEYAQNLQEAARTGNERTLAARLRQPGQLQTMEIRHTGRGMSPAKVPDNAAEMLAEGEFNRFYMRALCLLAIEDGIEELIVFRAKDVNNPRPESEAKIGNTVDPSRLLKDLRQNIGIETMLGIPKGPNSGLSVRLP